MKEKILCETESKDSYQEDGLKFFKQYANITDLSEQDIEYFKNNYHLDTYNYKFPVITARRRVDVLKNGEKCFWDWDYFDVFGNELEASESFGDSEYWDAKSVSEIHERVVSKKREIIYLTKKIKDLEIELEDLFVSFPAIYENELKRKRLFSKAKVDSAKDIVEDIRFRLMSEYDSLSKLIKDEILRNKKELDVTKIRS